MRNDMRDASEGTLIGGGCGSIHCPLNSIFPVDDVVESDRADR